MNSEVVGDLLLGVAVLEVRARDAGSVLRVGDHCRESKVADGLLHTDFPDAKSEDLTPPPLADFPSTGVLRGKPTPYYHIEVVASVPARSSSRVGKFLIRRVGELLFERARYVTASPVTDIGLRLYGYFAFRHVADENVVTGTGERCVYPIYQAEIGEETKRKLARF